MDTADDDNSPTSAEEEKCLMSMQEYMLHFVNWVKDFPHREMFMLMNIPPPMNLKAYQNIVKK